MGTFLIFREFLLRENENLMGWRNFGNFNAFLQFSPPLCKMLKGVFSSTVGNTSINGHSTCTTDIF